MQFYYLPAAVARYDKRYYMMTEWYLYTGKSNVKISRHADDFARILSGRKKMFVGEAPIMPMGKIPMGNLLNLRHGEVPKSPKGEVYKNAAM